VYELGGKDGANYALKFIESQAHQRDETNRLLQEIQSLKAQNTTLMLLAEDKNTKLHGAAEKLKQLRADLKDKED